MKQVDHCKGMIALIEELSRRHDKWQVFSDFLALSAISIRNVFDLKNKEEYEAQFHSIHQRYTTKENETFAKLLGELTLALEDDMSDILGKVFSQLELGNKWKGQFFTPDPVCRVMAKISLSDDIQEKIDKDGFITVGEPAVGGGAMVIAIAKEIKERGINYQKHLHVTAVDVDIRAVHMAYIQLSLFFIPAVIVHGDTLRMEEYSHWYTPAHVMGGWNEKLMLKKDRA